MNNALVPRANDRASIFGDTYGGVINPMTWRPHPYPSLTRGPIFATYDNRMSYVPSTWRKVPFTGFGAAEPREGTALERLGTFATFGVLLGVPIASAIAASDATRGVNPVLRSAATVAAAAMATAIVGTLFGVLKVGVPSTP